MKKQKDCEGEKSGSYSHAGLSLERLIQHAAEISLFSCINQDFLNNL